MSMNKRCLTILCCFSLMSVAPIVAADVIVTGGDPDSIYFNDRGVVGGEYMTRDGVGVGVGVNTWNADPAARQLDQQRVNNMNSNFFGNDARGMGGDALGGRSAGGGRR